MSKNIYLLYACDEYKAKSSMSLVVASTSQSRIISILREEIRSQNMDYKGYTGTKAEAKFREDVTHVIAFPDTFMSDIAPYVDYGFIDSVRDGEKL